MLASQPYLVALESGPLYFFREWPNLTVPRTSGAYTVWEGETLVYFGIARADGGLASHLRSHAAGRRSGDQFCVYVADRLVLPTLSTADIGDIAEARTSLDALVRQYIHDRLAYRFVAIRDSVTCLDVETAIKRGALGARPLLNP